MDRAQPSGGWDGSSNLPGDTRHLDMFFCSNNIIFEGVRGIIL